MWYYINIHLCEVIPLDDRYATNAGLFKALADINRLMIVDMLSRGELCACKILEKFRISQPTLSHHMRILCGCGLVNGRKEGKWTYYSLNEKTVREHIAFYTEATSRHGNCICMEKPCCEGDCL